MREDVVYGVCLPATGFSALFVLFALMTVVSVIVSGFICYHRQLAKVAEESAPEPGGPIGKIQDNANDMTLTMLTSYRTWSSSQFHAQRVARIQHLVPEQQS